MIIGTPRALANDAGIYNFKHCRYLLTYIVKAYAGIIELIAQNEIWISLKVFEKLHMITTAYTVKTKDKFEPTK